MKVIKEKTLTAPKFMVFSLPGMGKTTLASKLPNSLIIDLEGGANNIETPRTELVTNLEVFYQYMVELYRASKREYDYIVLDTADWLVRLVVEEVAGIDRKHLGETLNRSNGGYGNGKQVLENHIRTKLLPMLVHLNKKGYGICILAHAEKKDLMDGDGVSVEQITPKIDPITMNTFVEWCDGVFYLKKDASGNRKLLLDSDNVALAKNRYGLSGEIDVEELNKVLKGDK